MNQLGKEVLDKIGREFIDYLPANCRGFFLWKLDNKEEEDQRNYACYEYILRKFAKDKRYNLNDNQVEYVILYVKDLTVSLDILSRKCKFNI